MSIFNRKFTAEKAAQLRDRYEHGESCTSLANASGVATATITAAIRRTGGQIYNGGKRKFFWEPRREAACWTRYRLLANDFLMFFRRQRGLCLWCKKPLPLENLLHCTVDHIGGLGGRRQKEAVRGICCSDGHCNQFAGKIEANLATARNVIQVLDLQ